MHEISRPTEHDNRESIADIVDEQRLNRPLVLLFANLVVDGDLRVEESGLERRHSEIAVEVGRLLLVVLVEEEYHLTPAEPPKQANHELVQPVHCHANIRQCLVLGELVLPEVLRHRTHC